MRKHRRRTPSVINPISLFHLEHIFCGKIPFAAASGGHKLHLGHVGMMHHVGSVNSIDGGLVIIQSKREVLVEKVIAFVWKRER